MQKIKFQKIVYQSPLYEQIVRLREKVLRIPLGLKFSENDLIIDQDEQIFALILDHTPIACVQVRTLTTEKVKLRQMAVDSAFQKQGWGKTLLNKVEEYLLKQGIETIELHARKSAVDFYKKIGYQILSSEFTEVGLPHYKMRKQIS